MEILLLPACISPTPHRLNEYIVAPLSCALNACLILLIILRSPTELRVYSKVLLGNCVVDIVFTTACFVLEFHVSVRDGRFMGMLNGFFADSSPFVTFILVSLWAASLYSFVFIVSVPFLYRYLLICRGYKMNYKTFFGLVAAVIALSFLVPLALWVSYWPVQGYVGTDCYDPGQFVMFNAEEGISFIMVLPVLVAAVLLSGNYAVVVFCSWRTRSRLKANTITSVKTNEMNRQLTKILFIQAVLPLIVVVVPLMVSFAIIVFACSPCSFFLEEATSALAWVPLLNPTCTMLVVKPYRSSLIKVFAGFRNILRISPSSITPTADDNDLSLTSRFNVASR